MKRKLTAASIVGVASIIGLTGCGGPQLVFNGQELSEVEQSLEELDAAWKQSLTDGVEASVADDSRCYLQVSEETVAETAVCGPVHYLGDDETTWDGATWETVADGGDKYNLKQLQIGFTPGEQLQANTERYRPDGEESPAEIALDEPAAPVAEEDTPIWLPVGQAPVQAESSASKPGILKSPIGEVSVISTGVSDRVGDASNRLQAPEGTQFLTINFSELEGFKPSSDKSALAVVVGDKTYPIEAVEGFSVVLPVAGDAESALLRLTHDGLAQNLALSDLTRTDDAVAAGLYSDLATEPKDSDSRGGELSINATEEENAFSGTMTYNVNAERLAYDSEKKWPEAGKSWLKVIFDTNTRGPEWKGDGYNRGFYDLNRAVQAPTLQIDGETIAGEVGDLDQSFTGSGREIWFQVPAASPKATFSADLKVDGTLKTSSSNAKNAPASVEHVYQVRDVNLEFGPRTDESSS